MNCCLAYEKIKKEIFEGRSPTKNAGLLLYPKKKKKRLISTVQVKTQASAVCATKRSQGLLAQVFQSRTARG